VELTVDGPAPGEFRHSIVVDDADDTLGAVLDAALAQLGSASERGTVQLWLRAVDDEADTIARARGFRPYRDLWQLRCPLPSPPSGLRTRAFTDDDLEAFVAVNNRAFAWHPEQGGLTVDAVRATMAEDWFDPNGFRLLHDPPAGSDGGEGPLIGFCWTKIHADHEPPLGEIYVIAVDPSQHGKGLGKPMTLAGLEWLGAQGLRDGMLYVESDNDPANATYAALGFTRHHTDRAYRLDP
jgi:mycothiol synthase